MSDLGIVIVSYNVCALLRDCLKSAQANEGVRFSICVVDNGSPDDSAGMVEREFPQIHLIRNSNSGYAAGNNLGLRYFGFGEMPDPTSNFQLQTSNHQSPITNLQSLTATPRYALLLNPDTLVPPDAFARAVAYMDAHRGVGVLGVKLVRADGPLDLACRRSFPTPEVSFYRLP